MAPADNQSSRENSDIRILCLIAGKTQHCLSVSSRSCLMHTNAQKLFSVTSHKRSPNLMTVQVTGDGVWGQR